MIHPSPASADARVRLVLDSPGSASDRDPSDDEPLRLSRAAWLTVAILSAAARAEVLEDINGLFDSLEARAQPFGIDLSDGSPETRLKSISSRVLPVWAAARALVADAWRTGDGAYRVIAAPGDTAIRNPAREFNLWSERDRGRIPRAAAFAAWAVSGACLLETGESSRVAARLRERALNPHSALALVVDSNIQECRVLQAIDEQSLATLGSLLARAPRVKLARLNFGEAAPTSSSSPFRASCQDPRYSPGFR